MAAVASSNQVAFKKYSDLIFRESHPSVAAMSKRLEDFAGEARKVFGDDSSKWKNSPDSDSFDKLFWGLYAFHVDIKPLKSFIRDAGLTVLPSKIVYDHIFDSEMTVGGLRLVSDRKEAKRLFQYLTIVAGDLRGLRTANLLLSKVTLAGTKTPDRFDLSETRFKWLKSLPEGAIDYLIDHADTYDKYAMFLKTLRKQGYDTDVDVGEIERNIRLLTHYRDTFDSDDGLNPCDGMLSPVAFRKFIRYCNQIEDDDETTRLSGMDIIGDESHVIGAIESNCDVAYNQEAWLKVYYKRLAEKKHDPKLVPTMDYDDLDLADYEKVESRKRAAEDPSLEWGPPKAQKSKPSTN